MRADRPIQASPAPRTIAEAYLRGEASAFFESHPADRSGRLLAVERAGRPLSPQVAEVLEAQNARLAPSRKRDENLAALRRGARAVVTGQQMGLFLGPLYTVYKAASAIRVAKALSDESGVEVVPIFWLQTEDHDLPEIAESLVPGRDGEPVRLSLLSSDSRISIAHTRLPDELGACLQDLRHEIGHLAHGAEHLACLERHYRPGATWSESFAGLLAELFREEGLILLDPRDPGLAPISSEIHRRALVSADAIASVLLERVGELEARGFAVPVHVRRGAPLSFVHPEGREGPRYRLAPDGEGRFKELGGERDHSLEELLAILRDDPLRFSTSALLRPILQDSLLPTAAYVGGPGEIAYFAQLSPLFAFFDLPMPLVVPRARFQIIDKRIDKRLRRLGLSEEDAGLSEDEFLASCRRDDESPLDPEELVARLSEPLERTLDELRPLLQEAGPGLERAISRTRVSVERAISRLAGKYRKAHLRRDMNLLDDMRHIRGFLRPSGAPQERGFGLSYFAARYGERTFIEAILAATDPFDSALRDLRP